MESACRLSTNVIRLSKSISKHSLRSFLHCAECVFLAPSDSAKFIAFLCKKNRRATRCVAANIGVSYLPRFAVEKELESGELIELPFGEQSQTITAMCAHHAGKAVSPAMHTFIQCVEESFVAG